MPLPLSRQEQDEEVLALLLSEADIKHIEVKF